MQVVVTGIGLVSAFGNLSSSWHGIIAGRSAVRRSQPFPELQPLPLALINSAPADLATLTQIAVASALEDAKLMPPLPDCAVAIGSSRGCQAAWEQMARQRFHQSEAIKLENWIDTLPNAAALTAARQISSTAAVLSPMAACATGLWSIALAFELIVSRQTKRVIAGAVEAPITPLTLAGFQKMGALASTGAYPFDCLREGFALGEGGAVFVLESAEEAIRRGASIYGSILGFGLTADAYHLCAIESSGRSAIAAVNQCLERSKLSPADIDYIHAHGTGTQLNDRFEAQLIQQLFGQRVPVSSTKGATGHTLGASGAMGAAFCLMSGKHQILPPCVGLKQPEFDIDLVTAPRRGRMRRVLCFSFGFGGQNAAIALEM